MGNCLSLGCGEYKVFVTDRCGGRSLVDLTSQAAEIEWGRTMDDTSDAFVLVDLKGNGTDACCAGLGNSRTWIHSLAIYRDGERVWFGPLFNLKYKRDVVEVRARDISAWLDRRTIGVDLDFDEVIGLDVAMAILTSALGKEDPCDLLGRTQVWPSGEPFRATRTYRAGDGYAGDHLRDLARTHLDYTVLGDRIVLAHSLNYGIVATLRDAHFLVDLEVEERGAEAATQWTINGDGVQGVSGGIDPFYGLLEGVASEESLLTVADAEGTAESRVLGSNPAPVYVNVPDGARLSQKSPVCMEDLVPGALIRVSLRSGCREVDYVGRLTAVQVKVTAGDEAVGITLAPLGTGESEAGGTTSRAVS